MTNELAEQVPYEANVTDHGTVYMEPVGGWENSPGSNLLLRSDRINLTHDDTLRFRFDQWLWAECENGEISVSTFFDVAKIQKERDSQ